MHHMYIYVDGLGCIFKIDEHVLANFFHRKILSIGIRNQLYEVSKALTIPPKLFLNSLKEFLGFYIPLSN